MNQFPPRNQPQPQPAPRPFGGAPPVGGALRPSRPIAPYVALGVVVAVFAVMLAFVLSEPLLRWRYIVAGVLLGGLALFGATYAGVKIYGEFGKARAKNHEARNKAYLGVHNIPVPRAAVDAYSAAWIERIIEKPFDAKVIAAQMTPQNTPHSISITHAPPIAGAGGSPPALPDTVALVPDTTWLRWIDRAPHLLVGGRTGGGKTTLATALLIQRVLAGDATLILDPHYQPGKWAGLPAIGGGNDFEAILSTLPKLIVELDRRMVEYNAGKKTEDFQRLTVLIDETPAIVAFCTEMTGSGARRINDQRWPKFAQRLGSEARKVGISVILLTQSTLVQDILINSAFRENYLRIGLADQARPLLSGEIEQKRKQALYDLLRGQEHATAIEWKGDYHVLDVANVPDLAARNVAHQAQTWHAPTIPPTVRVANLPPRAAPPTAQLVATNQDAILDALTARGRMSNRALADYTGIDLHTVQTETGEMYKQRRILRHPARSGGERYEYSAPVARSA